MLETPVFASSKRDARGNLPAPAKTICYLNGHLIDERVQDVSKFQVPGNNTVLLEIESHLGDDTGSLTLGLWHNSPLTKATWYFHGGLEGLDETAIIGRVTNWTSFLAGQPWQKDNAPVNGQPTFWKCTFDYQHPAGLRESLGLITDGLKAGHVWLNGHNLGECPQTVLMYMPECWLNDGKNDLVILDLYGSHPDKVQMSRYESFSVAKSK
jgi:beta-galactosidase